LKPPTSKIDSDLGYSSKINFRYAEQLGMLHDDLGQANEDTSVTKQVGMKRQVEIG
jgi:hypothetical protein